MAKKPVKIPAKKTAAPAKKTASAVKPKAPAAHRIEKVCEDILKKLKSLDVEPALQGDIEWCLGSYRNDNNPSGLYIMAERALQVFAFEVSKNPKSVSTKLLKDIETALKSR